MLSAVIWNSWGFAFFQDLLGERNKLDKAFSRHLSKRGNVERCTVHLTFGEAPRNVHAAAVACSGRLHMVDGSARFVEHTVEHLAWTSSGKLW